MLIPAAVIDAVVGDDVGFHFRAVTGQFDVTLAQHMLRVSDGVCTGDHPGVIFVERALEHAIVGDGIRPVGGDDNRAVAPVFTAGKADDALANPVAFQQRSQFLVHASSPLVLPAESHPGLSPD
jgi:hypothetical protein